MNNTTIAKPNFSIQRLTVTPPEAAEMLGVSRMTVYRLIYAGRLKVIPGIRTKLIPLTQVQGMVASAE